MSNYRVIGAVTATLQNMLQDAISNISGSLVKTGRPEKDPGHEARDGVINIFLYQVQPNPTWRNQEIPFRRSDGTLRERPRMALDLYYLLSFYGDDSRKIPQLLLGQTISMLHAEAQPNPIYIPQSSPASEIDPNIDLGRADLRQEAHLLSFTPISLSHDDISKLWSIFFQVPYTLSMAYRCSLVMLESELVPRPALPVHGPPHSFVMLGGAPQLRSVEPAALVFQTGARLILRGKRLAAPRLRVTIGDAEATVLETAEDTLTVALPDGVKAGVNAVQVYHAREDSSAEPRWNLPSDPVGVVVQPRIVVRPTVREILLSTAQPIDETASSATLSTPTNPGERAVLIETLIAPAVHPTQKARLLLNAVSSPEGVRRSFSFSPVEYLDTTDQLSFRVPMPGPKSRPEAFAEPGDYLVRIEIEGVASPLLIDTDPQSSTYQRYIGPVLTLPVLK